VLQNLLLTERIAQTLIRKHSWAVPTIPNVRRFGGRSAHSDSFERAGADEANGAAEFVIAAAELMEEFCVIEV
jgi:hypothetical protein